MKFCSKDPKYSSFSDRLNEFAMNYNQPSEQEVLNAKSSITNNINSTNILYYVTKEPITINQHSHHYIKDFGKILSQESELFVKISSFIARCKAINILVDEGIITASPYIDQTLRKINKEVIIDYDDIIMSFILELDHNDIPYNNKRYNCYNYQFKYIIQK